MSKPIANPELVSKKPSLGNGGATPTCAGATPTCAGMTVPGAVGVADTPGDTTRGETLTSLYGLAVTR
jgi:hypothetical protein